MSFYDAIRVGASGAADFEIERSVRFRGATDQRFDRTLSSTSSSYTISMWFKTTPVTTNFSRGLFTLGPANNTDVAGVVFNTNDNLIFYGGNGTSSITTTRVFRDTSAWYHFTYSVNSNNFTAYINGESLQTGTVRSLDTTSNGFRIGGWWGGYDLFQGYIADFYLIDGLALTPSSFTKTNVETGQLIPKKYSGSFGTSGAHLLFNDNSGTTATTLGKDSSGNGNNFTPNNFSVSAGVGNDSLEDTPTNNFATLNPLKTFGNYALTNGNLTVSGSARFDSVATFAVSSGKWFWEITNTDVGIAYNGILNINQFRTAPGAIGSGGVYTHYVYDGTKYRDANPSGASAYGASYTDGDIVGVALNLDDNEITFYKNGTSQGAITIPNDLYTAYLYSDSGSYNYSINFGQRAFSYTAPTGYKALNSANLPDPTILLPNKHFNTLLYTGNDSNSRDITGVGFQPDWLWIKNRSQADFHQLVDAVRGANKTIYSNDTDNEQTDNANGHVNSFLADGFNVDAGGSGNVNENNENYVAWNWNAGNSDGATYRVVVVSDSGNKYRFRNSANTTTFAQSAVTLNLAEGGTYIFNMDDSTNASHPFSIGTAANGTVYTSGITYFLDGVSKTYSQYTSGFASATTRRLHITVPASAPQLYYWCSIHSGMGGQINTNSTLGSTNFDGTSLAVVKANTTAGFSIVTYTGTGSSTTVGHGLGIAPKVVLTRSRSSGGSWGVLHTESNPTAEHRINLDDNGGFSSYQGYNIWADTVPTSTVFTVNSDATTNASSVTYVGYVFSEVSSYSKFGKYTGNGNADGTFVFTGFRPAWIMLKNVNTSTWWFIYDVKRETFNPQRTIFGANVADAEYPDNAYRIDILSNGFKIRGTQNETNKSGDTISYFSFAESPFKNSRAR